MTGSRCYCRAGLHPIQVYEYDRYGLLTKVRELDLRMDLVTQLAEPTQRLPDCRLAVALIADALAGSEPARQPPAADDAALRYFPHLCEGLLSDVRLELPWQIPQADVVRAVREIELSEQRYQCLNRARTEILNAPLPITPDVAEEIVARLRLHTGAPVHVAESAFDETLSELQLEIDETRRHLALEEKS
jgi:hypothetical protein